MVETCIFFHFSVSLGTSFSLPLISCGCSQWPESPQGRVFRIPLCTSGRPAQEQIIHRPLIPCLRASRASAMRHCLRNTVSFLCGRCQCIDNTADGTGACCRCSFMAVCVCVCLFQFRGLSFILFPVQVICSASPAWIQIPFPLLLHS